MFEYEELELLRDAVGVYISEYEGAAPQELIDRLEALETKLKELIEC